MQSHLWHVLTGTELEQVGCSSASYSFTYAPVELRMGWEKVMKLEVSVSGSDKWTACYVQVALCTTTSFQLYLVFGNCHVSLSRHHYKGQSCYNSALHVSSSKATPQTGIPCLMQVHCCLVNLNPFQKKKKSTSCRACDLFLFLMFMAWSSLTFSKN